MRGADGPHALQKRPLRPFSFTADAEYVYCATADEVVRTGRRDGTLTRLPGGGAPLTAIVADSVRRTVYAGSRSGSSPAVGRPAGAAESQRRPSAPHPRSRRRLARHRVGDLRRDGNHALQPRDGRLQAFRTAALHRFLQHRHPDQDRRGRRTAVDQDEQLGIRLLRPRARRGQTLLQRSPAAQLPDDQRRRALRRARRRAVALDLPRTRAAQGGDPAPARRGLHPRLRNPRIRFRARSRADDRQPGPDVGRHARRRADRFRRREQTRLHAACAGAGARA